VPRQKSTGGKPRLGRISRLGDKYIRQLLIVGAQTVLLRSKVARADAWIQGLLARRPRLVVAIALAQQDGAHRLGGDGEGADLPAGGPGIV
jgi:transposase